MNPVKGTARAIDVDEIGRIVFDKFEDGVRFIVMRGPASWCAYVGVPNDHPLAGFWYDELASIDAHGGLTFAGYGDKKSWPNGYYWYGWDYAHLGDKSVYGHKYPVGRDPNDQDWTVDEVVKDSRSAIYNFKRLCKLAERIALKAVTSPTLEK